MVYCGKPSRGCQTCRSRRIKCDEARPTCTQCAKSRRQCPGYRDEFDLMFRNETGATERRAKKASQKVTLPPKKRKDSSSSSSSFSSSSSDGQGVLKVTPREVLSPVVKGAIKSPLELSIIPAIKTPTDTKATCHFVSNFVLLPRQGGTRGFLDYLIPLMKKTTESSNSHLQYAFNACALASLGNRVRADSVDLHEKAYNEYSKALGSLNIALRNPEEAKSDAVLAAVLLLGMFENMTAKQLKEYAWGSHIEGAIQLVKARGRKQLKTRTGLQLFISVRTQLIIHTLASGKAPAMGADWWINDAVHDTTATACQALNLKTAELRAEVTTVLNSVAALPSSRTQEAIEMVLALKHRSEQLDKEAEEWMQNLPDHWKYRTLCWHADHIPPDGDHYARAEVFPGKVDVYGDFWMASVWNLARATRLILSSITTRCTAWVSAATGVDFRTTPEHATAVRMCTDTIADILASVPYHLGWHVKRRHLFPGVNAFSGFACGPENDDDESGIKGLAGLFLTWPLGIVITQDYLTDAQRKWVQGRLRFIGSELGIRYAHIIAQLQIRVPSMLILRDNFPAAAQAMPTPTGPDFEKHLQSGSKVIDPASLSPLQLMMLREAMAKMQAATVSTPSP